MYIKTEGGASVILIVLLAGLLHWGVAALLPVAWGWAAGGVITLLAVLLMRALALRERQAGAAATGERGADAVVQVNAVDGVLLRTHEHFSTHFSGTNADLEQVQLLLGDAIAR